LIKEAGMKNNELNFRGAALIPVNLDKVNAVIPPDISGVTELSDFVDLYFTVIEIWLKAKADGSINLNDLALLGSFAISLTSALSGSAQAASEAGDLTDEEIVSLVARGDKFALGEYAPAAMQIAKEVLYKFQTWSVLKGR